MKHISVPIPGSIEIINMQASDFSPLISKCQIKVCYVGDEPNRNRTVITKQEAEKMAPTLRGSIIAGFYNEQNGDFEEHNKELSIENGEISYKAVTRPYGFVDLSARCWFQDFIDDGVPHTYLMTEGWLWTNEYPECQRVIDKGNNQSMEIDEKTCKGEWAKDNKTGLEFFIINEAIISKLCILGEDVEPCFEGASIQGAQKVQYSFSLDKDFQNDMKSMMFELNKYLNKGGEPLEELEKVIETAEAEAPEVEVETVDAETASVPVEEEPAETPTEIPAEPETAPEEEKEPEVDYELKYNELMAQYSALETERDTLRQNNESLTSEISTLKQFKLAVERKEKEEMINSFYMLSDEDKKDVRENIDSYSLGEIEAKLSVICFRNKVSFSENDNAEANNETSSSTTFSLNSLDVEESGIPAWIKAVRDVQKNKN